MSTAREKDQKDFDLEQIVELFDTALESDDPRIKDALRALLTITVLCTAERPHEKVMGPFERMRDDMHNLNRRLSRMEDELNHVKMTMPKTTATPYTPPGTWPQPPYTTTPTTNPWTGTNPNGPKPIWGPSWSSAGDDPAYKGAWGGATPASSAKLAEDFLKDLENKQ